MIVNYGYDSQCIGLTISTQRGLLEFSLVGAWLNHRNEYFPNEVEAFSRTHNNALPVRESNPELETLRKPTPTL